MSNFEFYTPTHVYFGRDTQRQVGDLVRAQGCKKVLVHFGGQSARRSGLLDQIEASLDAAGVAHVQLGGVVPNPHLSLVYQGIDLCKKEGVDLVLAGFLHFQEEVEYFGRRVLPLVRELEASTLEQLTPA